MNASPLSATVTTVASTSSGTATGTSSPAVAPRRSIIAVAGTVTQRSGLIRLATMSESWPAPIRPTAPATWVPVTSAPAAPGDQCRSWTSQTSAKVHTTNCGTTSSTDTGRRRRLYQRATHRPAASRTAREERRQIR